MLKVCKTVHYRKMFPLNHGLLIFLPSLFSDPRCSTSTNPQQTRNTPLQTDLGIGSMVEVLSKYQDPKYGVIRWIGFIPNNEKKTAGLELVS